MRRFLLTVLVLLTASCASGNPEMPEPGERSTNLNLQMKRGEGELSLRTTADVSVAHDTVSGQADDLFSLLPTVYDDLEVPINSVNSAARTLGALELRVRGDFAGERASRWIDCGTSITGSIAEQRELYLTLLTQIEPLEEARGRSGVSTHLKGFAVQSGRAGNRTNCSSTGRLERRIASELRKLAGGG